MRPLYRLILLSLLLPPALLAQKRCKKGIPCGGTCIAANKVCRVGGAPSTPAPVSPQSPRSPGSRSPSAAVTADSTAAVKVWVNSKSGVYHCPGTRWYGATKNGSYAPEVDALAAGIRPAYGKKCGS